MTSQTNHTAGPWVIPEGAGNGTVVCAGNGEHVGRILFILRHPTGTSHLISLDELDANARLCAAAPDLLEALRDLAYEVQGQAALIGSECEHAHQRALAAIAKASA